MASEKGYKNAEIKKKIVTFVKKVRLESHYISDTCFNIIITKFSISNKKEQESSNQNYRSQ